MNRRRVLPNLVLFVLASAVAAAPDEQGAATAAIGTPAPDFTLTDLDGRTHRLSDYRGRTVVLEWISAACPFVQRSFAGGVIATTIRDAKALAGPETLYLAIDSTGSLDRDAIVARSRTLLDENDLATLPVLLDHDGVVGRRYDARRTPHVFIIDRDGVLRFHGAPTDDPGGRRNNATNHVIDAIEQITNGEDVAPSYVVPWGCAIKYRKAE